MSDFITGGAGFIGSNLAKRLLSQGKDVVLIDDLSRSGSEKNLAWLRSLNHSGLKFAKLDITRDFEQLRDLFKDASRIFHLAAQVAVTTSVQNPRRDFEINALGTFNVLEAMRLSAPKDSALIYSSTNKVYGGMEDVEIVEEDGRYKYTAFPKGISEKQNLDFHSPYGCSKGAGDQYVRDYARIYDLNTVVFRQSCIYGPRQFGVEDQGWIAWFIIALLTGKDITIYGDGKQVRDVLYVDDLLDGYELALNRATELKGEVFNIGGGAGNIISIWEDFGPILEELFDRKIDVAYADWRPGDQRIYVSDTSKAEKVLGWSAKYAPQTGIKKLYDWVLENKALFLD